MAHPAAGRPIRPGRRLRTSNVVEMQARPSGRRDVATGDEFAGWEQTPTMRALRDLAAAIERVRHTVARRAGLSTTALQVLEHLLAGPQGVAELAHLTGVTSSAVTNAASGLVGAGLVRRRTAPLDRRRTLLELTPAGREETARYLGPVFAVLEALDDTVLPDERVVVDRYLKDATRAFGAVHDRVSGGPRP